MSEKITYENVDMLLDTGFNITFITMEHNSPLHWHQALEILYILNGNATVTVEGEHHHLNPLEFLVIDSAKIHDAVYNKNHTMGVCIHISKNFMRKFIPDIELLHFDCSMKTLTPQNMESYMKLTEYLKDLTILYMQQPVTYQLQSHALVLQILSTLIECFSTPMTETLSVTDLKNLERMDQITNFVEGHYKEPITLQDAADELVLNKEYFCRFFKKNTGISFGTYVNQIRIHHIYQELIHTQDPTMEIMERNGFFNQKVFYRMFKEIYDCTPRELRTLAVNNPYM